MFQQRPNENNEFIAANQMPNQEELNKLAPNKYLLLKEPASRAWKLYYIRPITAAGQKANELIEKTFESSGLDKHLPESVAQLMANAALKNQINEVLSKQRAEIDISGKIDEFFEITANFHELMLDFANSVKNVEKEKILKPYTDLIRNPFQRYHLPQIAKLKSMTNVEEKTKAFASLLSEVTKTPDYQNFLSAITHAMVNQTQLAEWFLKHPKSFTSNDLHHPLAMAYYTKVPKFPGRLQLLFKDLLKSLRSLGVDENSNAIFNEQFNKMRMISEAANQAQPLEEKHKEVEANEFSIMQDPSIYQLHNMGSKAREKTLEVHQQESYLELNAQERKQLNEHLSWAKMGVAKPEQLEALRLEIYMLYTYAYEHDRWKDGEHTAKGPYLKAIEKWIISLEETLLQLGQPGLILKTSKDLAAFKADGEPNREKIMFTHLGQFAKRGEVMQSMIRHLESALDNLNSDPKYAQLIKKINDIQTAIKSLNSGTEKKGFSLFKKDDAQKVRQEMEGKLKEELKGYQEGAKAIRQEMHIDTLIGNVYKELERMGSKEKKGESNTVREEWKALVNKSQFKDPSVKAQFVQMDQEIGFTAGEKFKESSSQKKIENLTLFRDKPAPVGVRTAKLSESQIPTAPNTPLPPPSPPPYRRGSSSEK